MTLLAAERTLSILRSELGDFLAALSDDNVVELLVNPDGSVWLDTHDAGLKPAGTRAFDATRSLLSTLATAADLYVNDDHPILETNLHLPGTPFDGARVHGLWAPLSTPGPTLSIRKRKPYPYDLWRDFLDSHILTPAQADLLVAAVADRLNILVCGGTGTGKTALATALLNLLPPVTERVILLEDVAEIVCPHLHTVPLRTNDSHGLPELVRTAMRLRPTRLVIGEVRGPEALNLLVAWTTGTPGGITTLHADDCGGALQRLALLIQLAGVPNPHPLIAQAIHLIVHIDGRGTQRTLRAIHHVKPRDGGTYATVPA